MIIKVKKLLFYGMKGDVATFFDEAQKLGFIEFISSSKKKVMTAPQPIKECFVAIKSLKKQEVMQQIDTLDNNVTMDDIVSKINVATQTLDKEEEKKRVVLAETARISPFGDFFAEDIKFIEQEGKRVVQFFCIKTARAKEVEIPQNIIYVGTDYDLDYYVSINTEKQQYQNMIEVIIDKTLHQLKNDLQQCNSNIKEADKLLKDCACYLKLLQQKVLFKLNGFHLESAKSEVFYPLDDSIFMIEAWVPSTHINELDEMIEEMDIDYEVLAIEEKERKPTCMENKGIGKVGEDLVNVYDTPSPSDKDPSLWVYFAFTVFFAMIVSDAGYGLVYLGFAALLKWRVDTAKKPLLHRFIKLTFALSCATILWGILSGSFFGMGPGPSSPLSKYTFLNYITEKKADYHVNVKDEVYKFWESQYKQISNAKNGKDFLVVAVSVEKGNKTYVAFDAFKRNILMEMSLIVGALHICLSLLRSLKRSIAGIGWVLFIIGGYLYFPSVLQSTSLLCFMGWITKTIAFGVGFYLIFIGIAAAILLAIIQKKLSGISEVLHVIQVFADILSYLRIYALGLAGMIMSDTFNMLGVSMPLYFGVLVIIIGHVVNISLSVMGGVIHGLRLNFIEWYHYCFDGDGKLFNPLRLLK
jgi:V/A-type H+/Na+-transporting ATPase subunit I